MRFCTSCICVFLFILPAPLRAQETTGPSRTDALQNYRAGRDLEYRGRRDDAEVYYKEAARICIEEIARNPVNMDAYAVLTWTLQRQRKYSEVIAWGERGLRAGGTDYRLIEIMGEASFYLDRYEDSLRYMERYTNALPRGDRASVAFFFIGEIFRLEGKFRLADIAYTTAVKLEPNSALWWYRLGQVRESSGDSAPAVEAYEQALRLDPNYREAREGLTRSLQSG
ncbi:MAG: tetratricopeptide repeat protein [Treponema sp.]|nr:tetratricopeptide repeat protein [Treponema sp.]